MIVLTLGLNLFHKTNLKRVLFLRRLLGPNQAKVVVQAIMDFTRTEKFEVQSAVANTGDNTFFKWQNISNEVPSGDSYLMPGMPVITQSDPLATDNRSYKKQIIFPQSFLKKLTVTVVLNKTVSDLEAANVRNVVSELLGMQIKRGDELIIVKSSFAPLWKTIWYSPETMSLLFKYGVLFLMGIAGMIIVAIGFLKLAGAMSSMAKVQQSHQITMDLGKNGSPAGGEGIDEFPVPESSKPQPDHRCHGGHSRRECHSHSSVRYWFDPACAEFQHHRRVRASRRIGTDKRRKHRGLHK